MKLKITKINIAKETKTNKNGKKYKSCGLESDSLQYTYFYNIYTQNDPVLGWKVGQEVDIELEDNGKWHNFKPLKENKYEGSTASYATHEDLKNLQAWVEKRLDDLRDEMAIEKRPIKKQEFDPNLPF